MINKITITGLYTGEEERGIMIGGKLFLPKHVQETQIFEDVFLNLREGEKNGWFKINHDNYAEFLRLGGRPIEATTKEVPATTEEVPATTEEVPATTEEVPATTEEVPATTEEVPATIEEVPAVTEAPVEQKPKRTRSKKAVEEKVEE